MAGIANKPDGSTWTDEQWSAISLQGENMLVAAAAGSGKTAVLVERIIRRISDEAQPMDVDRMLVATFTKAAASEMRQRIRIALEKEWQRKPESRHLRRQLALLNKASITTLHSFCLEVIRRHFQTVGLDPGFRIASDTEAELLRQESLEELLEDCYAQTGEGSLFWQLADWFSGERNDNALFHLIQRLYDFSRSHPWPEHWLNRMADAFDSGCSAGDSSESTAGGHCGDPSASETGEHSGAPSASETGEHSAPSSAVETEAHSAASSTAKTEEHSDAFTPAKIAEQREAPSPSEPAQPRADSGTSSLASRWFDSLRQDVLMELNGAAGLLRQAMALARSPEGPAAYADSLADDLALVDKLRRIAADEPWEQLHETFQSAAFGKLKAVRGTDADKSLQEQVKSLREQVKKRIGRMREEWFSRPPEAYLSELQAMAPLMRTLVGLVGEFGERYRKAKADKGLVDFADLEHFCLQALRHPQSSPDKLIPSDAAIGYREQFVEVLLDEYQDTNMVQEAIIALISRDQPGNRFMVGDVKQSIYRFRLAEPGLFLGKYREYRTEEGGPGRRIDLARNFRSRKEVVDGVNFLFRQLMNERVAEIRYDRAAELVNGADYPDIPENGTEGGSIELLLVDKSADSPASSAAGENREDGSRSDGALQDEGDEAFAAEAGFMEAAREQEAAVLEAQLIAEQIKRLMGSGGRPFFITDRKLGGIRPVAYSDIVILLRATQHWAPVMLEQLRLAGIPAYADLNTGYFTATEVETVISLLQIIDNPYQDIPLAGVLRSPIFGLTAEQLAQIRLAARGAYYEALLAYCEQDGADTEIVGVLDRFRAWMDRWRTEARQGSLADLIWRIYRETGYYDFAGGLPGGTQRQANLRALYDRCRQFEQTSFRGLFRFLRFIERMQETGGDLGTARSIGEQENVVRVMSIHKSKGLEFPVVFVAGLAKQFNRQDLNGSFLLHKELGFGPKYVDTQLRVSFPTLPNLAIKSRMRMEMLAEELRVLYVALTRPKEKLYLTATVRQAEKTIRGWAQAALGDTTAAAGEEVRPGEAESGPSMLPDYVLAGARSYLDWIGPALIRHPQTKELRRRFGLESLEPEASAFLTEPSAWRSGLIPAGMLQEAAAAAEPRDAGTAEALAAARPVGRSIAALAEEVEQRLDWRYPYRQASTYFSKTSVSEMKRLAAEAEEESYPAAEWEGFGRPAGEAEASRRTGPSALLRRPRFMEERKLSPTERGTVYHAVMQHLPLERGMDEERVKHVLLHMVEREWLTPAQMQEVDPQSIVSFMHSELGERLLGAKHVYREVPFSLGLKASDVYPAAKAGIAQDLLLIQGVIDCMFEEEDGLVLLDYKTDALWEGRLEQLTREYTVQLGLYARAVEEIWKRPVKQKLLYFLNGPYIVEV